jgi:hypothetical protein
MPRLVPVDAERRGRCHALAADASELDAVDRVTSRHAAREPNEVYRRVDQSGSRVRTWSAAVAIVTLDTRSGIDPRPPLGPLLHEPRFARSERHPALRIEVGQRPAERGGPGIDDRRVATEALLSELRGGLCG